MSPLLDLSIRVLAAAFVGAVIGYEREVRAKGAGMRTHVLVALGAAMGRRHAYARARRAGRCDVHDRFAVRF